MEKNSPISINCILDNPIELHEPISQDVREKLMNENKNANFSYRCLLREVLSYRHNTLATLLSGWSGIQLVTLSKNEEKKLGIRII